MARRNRDERNEAKNEFMTGSLAGADGAPAMIEV